MPNEPNAWANNGAGEPSGRLPRIKTSHADDGGPQVEGGPRSAPINGPLRPPPESYPSNNGHGHGPIRSSSSPDPWLSHSSRGTSPNRSPTDHRGNFASGSPLSGPSVLGIQQGEGSGHGEPLGNVLIPPRSSSQSEYSRPITPESSSHFSVDSYDPATTPRNAMDATQAVGTSDRTLQQQQQQQSTTGGSTRSGRKHEPAFCGQCGEVVHGQFVRAMGKVYHLHCFRCKVSRVPSTNKTGWADGIGLWKSRCAEVFPSGRARRNVPVVREGLLCSTGFDLCEV